MTLVKCKECGIEAVPVADKCPGCGAPLKKERLGCLSGTILTVLGIVLFCFAVVYVIDFFEVRSKREEQLKQQQIAAQQQKKKEEEQRRIVDAFTKNKKEILSNLELLIDQKEFDGAEKEIKKYDIPSLAADLSDTKTHLTETKLNEKAKGLLTTDVEENFWIYNRLVTLRSDSPLYRERYKYYRLKLADKKYAEANSYFQKKDQYSSDLDCAIDAIDRAARLNPDMAKKCEELGRKLKNIRLSFYEGNASVLMAVSDKGVVGGKKFKGHRIGGKRCLYVWIKNISSRPFHVNPNDFTLVCKDDRSYHYHDSSDGLLVDLQPGTKTGGRIYFKTYSEPRELVYSNFTAGRISRVFP